jgi:hypothetical protein
MQKAGGEFKGMGLWLVKQKQARHADQVNLDWLKDYQPPAGN